MSKPGAADEPVSINHQNNKTMKPKLILKSLADLPANTHGFASSVPGRAMNASKQMLGASARATRREIRAARRRSAELVRALYARPTRRLKACCFGSAAG